jgi:hypothetical protein
MTSGHCRQRHKTMGGGPADSDFIMETVPAIRRPARRGPSGQWLQNAHILVIDIPQDADRPAQAASAHPGAGWLPAYRHRDHLTMAGVWLSGRAWIGRQWGAGCGR